MRVGFVSHNACAGDAVGNQLAEKVRFFLDRSADVRVFIESANRVHPHVAPVARPFATPEVDPEAWRFLSACDLVFVEYSQYYPALELLPLLAETKARVVVDYHGVTPPRWRAGHNREAVELGVRRRGLIGCTDAVLTHSQFTRDELLRAVPLSDERCHDLGYVVDGESYRHDSRGHRRGEREILANASGSHAATRLLFVGRVAANKRLPVLVEAVARLRERRPEVHALVAGDITDLYQEEHQHCLVLAGELGVADRLHFLGHVSDGELPDLYRSADLFVMPSRHEGFCLPVVEAMASGVPVIAARATALPETVADAGLSFEPDNADDLANQICRVLDSRRAVSEDRATQELSVAVVAFRYGDGFAGGAEASLRTIARALHDAGHRVTVWTTCNRAESDWSNHLPEGNTLLDGISVRRFRIDPHDHGRHLASLEALAEKHGDKPLSAEQERAYVEHSVHSTALLESLRGFDRTEGPFDAVIVGPYLFGLTHEVARAFTGRTLVLPCFHDEPLARLRLWREVYGPTGGILYHSPEEQHFVEAELGLNHPGAWQLGTWLDVHSQGDAESGRRAVGAERYVVYCGRYSAQKDVPGLVEFARRYGVERPGRFAFVFLGQGEVTIPCQPGFRDLGFVPETVKRDVLAGAAALVQLSRRESLSLTVLEAWAQGTPVLVSRSCAVLAGQVERGRGGRSIADYPSFAAALDDLFERPGEWCNLGRQGNDYVRERYGDRACFVATLESAIHDLTIPLYERMRRRGLARAAGFGREMWRGQFARVIEGIFEADKRPCRELVETSPRAVERAVRVGIGSVLVPLRVHNRGTHPLACAGPARTVLRCRVSPAGGEGLATLPRVLSAGESLSAALSVPVPTEPGRYRIHFWVERSDRPQEPAGVAKSGRMELIVTAAEGGTTHDDRFLDGVRAELAELEQIRELPTDYLDVTAGFLASWKRRAKRKLLNNFKKAYVDVLSRRQSACNRHVLRAVQELVEYCATLEHALSALQERLTLLEAKSAPRRKRRDSVEDGRRGD
jgi:glycosyltransferase involved in cell wall biosynthesis